MVSNAAHVVLSRPGLPDSCIERVHASRITFLHRVWKERHLSRRVIRDALERNTSPVVLYYLRSHAVRAFEAQIGTD